MSLSDDPADGDFGAGATEGYAVLVPTALDGNDIISCAYIAVFDADVVRGVRIYPVRVGRVRRSAYREILDSNVAVKRQDKIKRYSELT